MKIRLDKEKHALIINDDLKTHLMIVKFMFVINLISSGLNVYKSYRSNSEMDWTWLILGFVSLGALFFVFTRSTKKIISMDEISYVFKRIYFGSKRYFLKLKNGKIRNLPFVEFPHDILELESFLEEYGIKGNLNN